MEIYRNVHADLAHPEKHSTELGGGLGRLGAAFNDPVQGKLASARAETALDQIEHTAHENLIALRRVEDRVADIIDRLHSRGVPRATCGDAASPDRPAGQIDRLSEAMDETRESRENIWALLDQLQQLV